MCRVLWRHDRGVAMIMQKSDVHRHTGRPVSSPVASLRSSGRQGGLAACKTLGKPAEAAESTPFGLPG